jgi:hypothetical protein
LNSKLTTIASLTLVFGVLTATRASAQMTWTDKGFVNVTFGVQGGSHSLETSSTFDLYGEQGSLATTQDVGGGRSASDADVAIAAQVPHPNLFDTLRPLAAISEGSEHSESAFHLHGTWMVPVTDKVDVGLSFGPTIFAVSQDVPAAITVSEPTPTLASTTITRVDKTTVGVHFGADVTYLVTPRFGAGLLLRYAWGSADIEGASDSLTVGGFQIGAGLRVRF